jgi:hypothetical protein
MCGRRLIPFLGVGVLHECPVAAESREALRSLRLLIQDIVNERSGAGKLNTAISE